MSRYCVAPQGCALITNKANEALETYPGGWQFVVNVKFPGTRLHPTPDECGNIYRFLLFARFHGATATDCDEVAKLIMERDAFVDFEPVELEVEQYRPLSDYMRDIKDLIDDCYPNIPDLDEQNLRAKIRAISI